MATTANKMFGPLTFDDNSSENYSGNDVNKEISCILCDNTFNLVLGFDIFVKHIFEVHNVVIEEIQHIENLPEYIKYWKDKLKAIPIEEIVPSIDCANQNYYLISTLLKEDKELRHKLKLEHVLKIQEFERTDTNFIRQCLFCRLNFEGTRPDFLQHLATDHNLQLGNPQNLVFIEELIEKINQKLNSLQCIFCQRTFPERNILKEHMRKKLHKRINRNDKEYDKFYIVNYLESDKQWRNLQKEGDDDVSEGPINLEANSDIEYSDWNEKEDLIICLFCDKKETNINNLCLHMEADHEFDFVDNTKTFDFYQKVKFINYVRRQTHNNKCFYCDANCNDLQKHFIQEEHCKMPQIKVFDQPEFYFPTYENDAFLYLIDDVED